MTARTRSTGEAGRSSPGSAIPTLRQSKAGADSAPGSAWPASREWARVDLNHRPHAYQACALTKLSYEPGRKARAGNPARASVVQCSRLERSVNHYDQRGNSARIAIGCCRLRRERCPQPAEVADRLFELARAALDSIVRSSNASTVGFGEATMRI